MYVPYTVKLRLLSWCCIWNFGNDSVRVQFVRWSLQFSHNVAWILICVVKSHPDQDGAEPSPNSEAASNLQRLSAYLGRPVDPSPEAIYKTFNEMMSEHPVAIPELLAAFIHHSRTTKQVNRNFFPVYSIVTMYIRRVLQFYLPRVYNYDSVS